MVSERSAPFYFGDDKILFFLTDAMQGHDSPQISFAISLINASFADWSSGLNGYPLS